MTRIRYKKTDNTLVSSKPVLCNTRLANIVLYMDKMQFQIIDINNKEVLAEGVCSSMMGLKKKAKDSAKNIGANFYDEVRNTKEVRRLDLNGY